MDTATVVPVTVPQAGHKAGRRLGLLIGANCVLVLLLHACLPGHSGP